MTQDVDSKTERKKEKHLFFVSLFEDDDEGREVETRVEVGTRTLITSLLTGRSLQVTEEEEEEGEGEG